MSDTYIALVIAVLIVLLVASLIINVRQLLENDTLRSQAEYDAETVRFLKSEVSAFDHDGDGRAGGRAKGPSTRP